MIVDLFGDDKMEQSKEDKALEAESNEIYDTELTDEEKVDRKLMEIGIQEKYAKKYREVFPDKGIFYRGNLLKHFFLYYLEAVENATELQHVEQSFLTPSQVKLINSKLQESDVMFVEDVKELDNDLFGGSEGKIERIEKYTKDAIYTIHIVDRKELKVIYDTLTSCFNCSKERLCCGETAACPVCDELMTDEEYAFYVKKFAPQSEGNVVIKEIGDGGVEVHDPTKITVKTKLSRPLSNKIKGNTKVQYMDELDASNTTPKQTEKFKCRECKNVFSISKRIENNDICFECNKKYQTESEVETIETKIGSANLVEIPGDDYSFITLITGYEGSGKTVAAATFPFPFLISLEKKKIYDLIKYPPLIFPEFGNFKENKDYVIANVMEKGIENKQKTYDNVLKWVNWFKNQVDKKTLVIDTAKRLWDIAWGRKAQQKGTLANPKPLGKVEYIPITTELKGWVLDLMHWCRDNNRSLVFTSHTTGKYIDINQYDSIKTGEEPDAKYWIREAVSWRIDLLKPDQTLMEGKFIADFQKAPGRQYFKIDLTDKKLFEIINSRERLEEEIEIYKSIATPEENNEEGGLF